MLIVPSVLRMYQAHKERQARINAAAIKPKVEPIVVQPCEIKPVVVLESKDKQALRELAAHWRAINARKRAILVAELSTAVEARIPTFKEILQEVTVRFGVTELAIKSPRRDAQIVRPRQIVCYLAKTETPLSFPAIGRFLGSRDHTTILHAVKKVERLIREGDPIKEHVEEIRASIKARLEAKQRMENEINADLLNRLSDEVPSPASPDCSPPGIGGAGEAIQRSQERTDIAASGQASEAASQRDSAG